MGSSAQDERHERFLREAGEEVAEIERQITVKESELKALREKLVAAKQALGQQQAIDERRD
ncbi:hypothetical protein ACXKTX_36235 [Burkholderia gladioli]